MRLYWGVVAGALALVSGQAAADAAVSIKIDKTQQRMTVEVDGKLAHVWPVSTARAGYATPSGSYRPLRLHRMWYSQKYDNSPMPHAIFFSGGYAIHGTGATRQLGSPASHGCVRLAPAHAAALYALVQQHGMSATRIQLFGNPRQSEPFVARRDEQQRHRSARVAAGQRYHAGAAAAVSAYDPRFFGGSVQQVRYVHPYYILAPASGFGGGSYLIRAR